MMLINLHLPNKEDIKLMFAIDYNDKSWNATVEIVTPSFMLVALSLSSHAMTFYDVEDHIVL